MEAIASRLNAQTKSGTRFVVIANGLEAIAPGWRPALRVYSKHES